MGRAASQSGSAAAPSVVRANQVGPRKANLLCSNAAAAAFELGATIRSQTAYTRLPLSSVGSAVSDSLSLKLLPSGIPVFSDESKRTVVGSVQLAVPWAILDTSTAFRVVVRSTDRLIDHRSPLGAHDTHGSDERP